MHLCAEDSNLGPLDSARWHWPIIVTSSEQPYEGLTNLNKERVAVKDGEVQENSWRLCKVQPPMKESNYPLYSDTSEDHPYIDHTEDQLPFGESLNGTKAWSYPFR